MVGSVNELLLVYGLALAAFGFIIAIVARRD
jgi:hypothetical protein